MDIVGLGFILSVVFLCTYGLAAKRFENRLISRSYVLDKGIQTQGRILVIVGIAFSCLQAGTIVFSEFELGVFPVLFIWFCTHGIFVVMVLRVVWGLFKCLRQIKKQVH